MNPIRVVFMGTSRFAVPILCSLMADPFHVVLVVTQPDRPQGRHQHLEPPCCKVKAAELSARIVQPEKIRTAEFYGLLESLAPDVVVTASYGKILTDRHLQASRYGVINVHASLLPALRGAAPINWAIIEGHARTGISIMKTCRDMDAGPILRQCSIDITAEDDVDSLELKLADLGAALLPQTLKEYLADLLVPIEQDHQNATYAPKLQSLDGMVDWSCSSEKIARHIRGMTPRPGAFSIVNDLRIKVHRAVLQDPTVCGVVSSAAPGCIVGSLPNKGLLIQTGSGLLRLEEVQPPSKARMRGDLLINGRYVKIGDRFQGKPTV